MSHSHNIELKRGIWTYFILLLFEGALRKWVLPEYSNLLLLVRDPLVIFLFLLAKRRNIVFFNNYLFYILTIAIIGLLSSLIFGHGNLLVSLFGFRIFALHLPMIFLIGKVFDKEDVLKMGNFILWLSIPMTLLIIAQFYSPQSAWVNRGVGGDMNGAGFSGAMGYMRPPGTFSFISGTTSFYSLLSVFVIYFWVQPEKINKVILILSSICLICSIPFSISRTLFFEVIFCLLFSVIGITTFSKKQQKSANLIFGLVGLIFLLSFVDFLTLGLEVFSTRFQNANKVEGGIESVLLDRYLGGLIAALIHSGEQPFLGYGLGYGSNVGSFLLTTQRTFLISEGEWGRLIGELGPALGIGIILIRLSITFQLLKWAWFYLKNNELLPWILFSLCVLVLPQTSWSQPTSLGFCTMITGLLVASISNKAENVL